MSLVNEALKKARLEAAREAAANRNVPYPALGRGEREPRRAWIAAFAGLVLLAGIGGFFLFRAGKQSALRADAALPAGGPSAAESAAGLIEPGAGPAAGPEAGDFVERPAAGEPDRASLEPRGAADAGASAAAAERSERVERAQAPPPRVPRERRSIPRSEPATPAPVEPAEPSPSQRQTTGGKNADSPPQPERIAAPQPERVAAAPPEGIASETPEAAPEPERGPSEEPSAQVEAVRSANIPGVGSVELGGIAWSGDRPFALVNGRVVRPGDSVAGLVVAEIQSNTVRLSGAAGDWVLRLK